MLLFLHGFLGQKEDWAPLLAHLSPSIPTRSIDLPGHGKAPLSNNILETVKEQAGNATILVGYSAGGRIALHLKERYPATFEKIILLSAHPGLHSEEEKHLRWQVDQEWIQMLREKPFPLFLEKWYAQDLFLSLKKTPYFPEILARRKNQDPEKLALFLEQCSAGKTKAARIFPHTTFIYGEEDLKYAPLYRTLSPFSKVWKIANAGHAVHLEQPQKCAQIIEGVFYEHSGIPPCHP